MNDVSGTDNDNHRLSSRILPPPFKRFASNGWIAELPDLAGCSDFSGADFSELTLYENGTPLGPAHSPHTTISQAGAGSFSHWGADLYFSTSDNSDPNTNGRQYEVNLPERPQWTPLSREGCLFYCNQASLFDGLLRIDLEITTDGEVLNDCIVDSARTVRVLKKTLSKSAPFLARFASNSAKLRCFRIAIIAEYDVRGGELQVDPSTVANAVDLFEFCQITLRLKRSWLQGGARTITVPLIDITQSHWSFRDGPYERLVDHMAKQGSGVFLEIGGRGDDSKSVRDRFGASWRYTAIDIKSGFNVDVVGDVHTMSRVVEPDSIDVVYSVSVFEHLFMPWKAVLEISSVLKPGGLCYVHAPYFWPVHELPWDFFRFSKNAWSALFNRFTGFELLDTANIGLSRPVAHVGHRLSIEAGFAVGPMATSALARKVGNPATGWEGYSLDIIPGTYPS